MDIKISPSLACADQLTLKTAIQQLEKAGVDSFHIDIMDGRFVDNLGFNFASILGIKGVTDLPLELHLMVEEPQKYLGKLPHSASDIICFHVETVNCPLRVIEDIRSAGTKAGIVLTPATAVENYYYLLDFLDRVVVLTVEPGFAGQRFIPSALAKVARISSFIKEKGLGIEIEVDGNINIQNAVLSIQAGASVLVAGTSSVFRDSDIVGNFRTFKSGVSKALRAQRAEGASL